MAEEGFKRKLTAILSADVAGYSRLMGEDEAETVKTLTAYRKIMGEMIQQHRGRVIDSPGDNLLAEFPSVVDAVQYAVAAQNELKARNAELPENRRMEFRIGVNLGDVIEEEGRIYGDGVNIAARIEGLAEPGGICISGSGFEQVRNKLLLGYQYLGEQTVKNIMQPIKVYRVLMEPESVGKVIGEKKRKEAGWRWAAVAAVVLVSGALALWNFYFRPPPIEPASKENMALPLPDIPSIAVLPFVNMSDDPKQEFFSDAVTENIITGLSKLPQLFVIARNSTFTYKGKPVKVKQVSEELGVQYVLEGSVQKSGDRVRITAQLIDALKGYHIWAERYDRDLTDLFAVQDEITLKILSTLHVKLTGTYRSSAEEKYFRGKQSFDCYSKLVEGAGHNQLWNIEDNNLARRLAEEAVAMCPEIPSAYSLLGWVYHHDYYLGNTKSPQETLKKSFELAQKALALDDSVVHAHALLCQLYSMKGDHDKAIAEGERAVSLDPNGADTLSIYAWSIYLAGRHEEAVPLFQTAIRLNPFGGASVYRGLGQALRDTGRMEEAVSAFKTSLQRSPNDIMTHLNLAATYSMIGREKEASIEAAEVLRINPKFSLEKYAKTFTVESRRDVHINALRKAGLPETPPLPLPDKPSIAVLPFVNMSGDPEQEYFSDGITEEIITALSKTPKLFVIARTSSFKYKGKEVDVRTVGRELGVKCVLEGSVQKAENKVRITAQLVDAQTGNHLWAERYDRDLKDIFALQDEVTFKVIAALQVKLTEGEQALITSWGTHNFEAYAKFLKGQEYARRWNREGNLLARKMAEEVIVLDPRYPQGYMLLGSTHMMDVWLDLTKSPPKSLAEAVRLYQKVIAMHPSDANTCGRLGIAYTMMRQHEKGIAELEKAIALNPNVADNHAFFGFVLHLNGRNKEALVEIKKAIRLNPFPPNIYFFYVGNAYLYEGMYDESITAYKKALTDEPNNLFTHLRLAAAYSLLDREDDAHAEAAEVLRINSKFSLEHFSKTVPFKNQADTEYLINALRKAGLR